MNINIETILSFKYKTIYNINKKHLEDVFTHCIVSSTRTLVNIWYQAEDQKSLFGGGNVLAGRGDGGRDAGQEALQGTNQRCHGD